MGMFSSVLVPCPDCGEEQEVQSKAGDHCMGVYRIGVDATPTVTLADVEQQTRSCPLTCRKCQQTYWLKLTVTGQSVPYDYVSAIGGEEDD